MKINNVRGYLIDISAKTATLKVRHAICVNVDSFSYLLRMLRTRMLLKMLSYQMEQIAEPVYFTS